MENEIEDIITEDYVSFETAKLLKEKGFNEPCNNRYYETHHGFNLGLDPGYTNSHWEDWYKDMGVRNYSAPTLQMAMKWLRKKHKIFFDVNYYRLDVGDDYIQLRVSIPYKNGSEIAYEGFSLEELQEKAVNFSLKELI